MFSACPIFIFNNKNCISDTVTATASPLPGKTINMKTSSVIRTRMSSG